MLTGWTAVFAVVGFIVCFLVLYFCVISFVIKVFREEKINKNNRDAVEGLYPKRETMSDVYSKPLTLRQVRQFDRMEWNE